MNRLATSCWLGAALVVAPLPATASQETATANVCGAIARIAASANVRPAFLPIRRAVAGGQTIVPGFEADECTVTGAGVACRGTRYADASRSWPDLATCPGVVVEESLPSPRRLRWPSNRSYRLGRFFIARGVSCPGCRALGPPYFIMSHDPSRDRRP